MCTPGAVFVRGFPRALQRRELFALGMRHVRTKTALLLGNRESVAHLPFQKEGGRGQGCPLKALLDLLLVSARHFWPRLLAAEQG